MPTMPTLLSLKGNQIDKTGWHERDAGPYDAAYANSLEEPAGTEPHRMLAAIPSPFARLHVFDIAFGFLSDPERPQAADTVFHQVVSQCLDAIELLFHWTTLVKSGFPLEIVRWDAAGEMAILREERLHPGHALLTDALALYLDRDRALSGAKQDTWMLVSKQGPAVLAVSSPLTLVAPAPNAAQIATELALKAPGETRIYFTGIVSLAERTPAFRAYLSRLFTRPELVRTCAKLHKYVSRRANDTASFLEQQALSLIHI